MAWDKLVVHLDSAWRPGLFRCPAAHRREPLQTSTDVHQHLWPPELLAALERRSEPPCARREGAAWWLHVSGEPAAAVAAQEGTDRAGGLAAQGVDRALLSLSTALRVETLAGREAQPLLDAWRAVVRELPSALGAWGTLNLRDARPADVDALLDEGFVGLSLPPARSRTRGAWSASRTCSIDCRRATRRSSSTRGPPAARTTMRDRGGRR